MSETGVLLMCVNDCLGPNLILNKIFNFMDQVKSMRREIFFDIGNHEDWNNFWVLNVERLFLSPYMNSEEAR